jgi:hypothetical protein
MEKYRKLTETELTTYGITKTLAVSKSDLHTSYRNFVKKYYDGSAVLVEVVVHSEFNDNTYDNDVRMVVVYDAFGDEVVPRKDTAKQCRAEMVSLRLGGGPESYESREPAESFFVQMNPTLPELYVKV